MRKIFLATLFIFTGIGTVIAQDAPMRPITMEEYELAHTFEVDDLDNDTYVKFDNTYILDRYEFRKPIFVTGDDGLRKRFDLYKLVAKEDLMELGLVIFYTNEKDELYKTVLPNYLADGAVWEEYFEDIHSVNKEEENFVLKLSYVLSRELSFQIYKGLSEGEMPADEHATYGTDICFPGDQLVTLMDGSSKAMKDIRPGDKIITVDPVTSESRITEVNKLVAHTPENYAITKLVVIASAERESDTGKEITISPKILKATPNHPMMTNQGKKEIGKIGIGEKVLSFNEQAGAYEAYTVIHTTEITEGVQSVYSIEAKEGETLMVNGVMVRQKR